MSRMMDQLQVISQQAYVYQLCHYCYFGVLEIDLVQLNGHLNRPCMRRVKLALNEHAQLQEARRRTFPYARLLALHEGCEHWHVHMCERYRLFQWNWTRGGSTKSRFC